MEGIVECKDCKTWEEDMYWKHFNAFHFLVTLPPDFHDHLVLPEKFASHMKARLPEKVSLKGPSGASWEIQLQKSDDLCFVGKGWKEFVKAHNLNENCHLMFKCKKDLSFKVLIFDKGSLCEREAAYFIKKCSHTGLGHENHRLNAGEVSRTEIENDEEDDGLDACSGGTQIPRKRGLSSSGGVGDQPFAETAPFGMNDLEYMSNRREVTALGFLASKKLKQHHEFVAWKVRNMKIQTARKRVLYGIAKVRAIHRRIPLPFISSTKPKAQSEKESAVNVTTIKEVTHEKRSRFKKQRLLKSSKTFTAKSASTKKWAPKEYMSKRRKVTEQEKENALQRAIQEETETSFTVVLPPTAVYRAFLLSIPTTWLRKHPLHAKQNVLLRVGEKTWLTSHYTNGSGRGQLIGGWKKFALDNNLEEFDVLVFEPVSQKEEATVMLDVSIFRVVSSTIPPFSVVN